MILTIRKFDENPTQLPPQFSFEPRPLVQLSPQTEILSSCTAEKDLILVDISSNLECRNTFLHGISSYTWRQAEGLSQDELVILTVTHDVVAYTLDLASMTFQVVGQWTSRALLRALGVEQLRTVKILEYRGTELCLLLDSSLVVRLELGRELRVSGRLEMPPQSSPHLHSGLLLLSSSPQSLSIYSLAQSARLADWAIPSLEDQETIEWAGPTPNFTKIVIYTSSRRIEVLESELSAPEDIESTAPFSPSPTVLHSLQLPPSLDCFHFRDCALHDEVACMTFATPSELSTMLVIASLVDSKVECKRLERSLLLSHLHGATVLLSPQKLSLHFHKELAYLPKDPEFCGHLPSEIARKLSSWNDFSDSKTVLVHSLDLKEVDVPYMFLQSFVEEVRRVTKDRPPGTWKIKEQQEYFSDVLAEIYYTFQQNVSTPSQEYGLLLLNMLRKTLEELLLVLEEYNEQSGAVEDFRQLICLHAIQVRNLIHEDQAEDEEVEEVDSTFDQWDDYLLQEVVDSALISGEMLKLTQYLATRKKLSGKEIQVISQRRSRAIILDLIVNNHLFSAKNFISQIGLSYKNVFLSLFKTSADPAVQTNLYTEVKDILNDAQLMSIFNLRNLQTLYPCTSIEKALPFYTSEKVSGLLQAFQTGLKPPQWKIGDLGPADFGTIVPGRYFFPIFDWCKDWNESTWERIFLEAYLTGVQASFLQCSPATCWQYLFEHSCKDLLKAWVDTSLDPEGSPLFQLPLDLPDFSLGPPHLREEMLNMMARQGKFSEDELEVFPLLLQRLGRSRRFTLRSEEWPAHQDYLQKEDFSHRLIHFCLKHNLISVLFFYLTQSIASSPIPSCFNCSSPVLHFIKVMKNTLLKKHPTEGEMYKALLATAQYVYNISPMERQVLQKLRAAAPPDIFLATVISSGQPLLAQFSAAELRLTLQPHFPILAALLEPDISPDITVYQLLQANKLFDISRLFVWQKANNLRGEDSPQELPHFTRPELVQSPSSQETLSYVYYLLQGRPSMALHCTQSLTKSGLRSQLQALALRHHDNMQVAAACVALLEMWGLDSHPLAVHLHMAKLLGPRPDLVHLLEDDSEKGHAELAHQLEAAIDKLQDQQEERTEVTTATLWLPVVSYFHLHQCQPPARFLEEAALAGDWLAFFLYAHICQLPLDQVLVSASKFPNAAMADNVTQALRKVKGMLDSLSENNSAPRLFRQISLKLKAEAPTTITSKMGIINDPKTKGGKLSVEEIFSSDLGDFSEEEDLLGAILACGQDVGRLLSAGKALSNPVLALIASHCGGEGFQCMAVWLGCFLGHHNNRDLLLQQALGTSQGLLLLLRGLRLFSPPECPLLFLAEFFVEFLVKKQYEEGPLHLSKFVTSLKEGSAMAGSHQPEFSNKKWLLDTSLSLLKHFLLVPKPFYEQDELLRQIAYSAIEKTYFHLKEKCPRFNKLYQLTHPLEGVDLPLDQLLLPESSPEYFAGFWSVIRQLQEQGRCSTSLALGDSLHLPISEIIISEINLTSKSFKRESISGVIAFWSESAGKLNKYSIPPEAAFKVFNELADNCLDFKEKFIILRIAEKWVFTMKIPDLEELSHFYYDLWHGLFKAYKEDKSCLDELKDLILMARSHAFKHPLKFACPIGKYSQEELEIVGSIMDWLLSHKLLFDCGHIHQVFHYSTPEYHLVKHCLAIVRGDVKFSASEDTAESTMLNQLKALSPSERRVLEEIEELSRQAPPISSLFENIKVLHLTALTLRKPYDEVSQELDFFKLIKLVFITKAEHRFQLIKSLAQVGHLPVSQLTNFIAEEVLKTVKYWNHDKAKLDAFLTAELPQILVLGNSVEIGNSLMSYADNLMSEDAVSDQNLSEVAELYIGAHASYTELCWLEGISQVLERVRAVCNLAAERGQLSLVVRLLMTLRRFPEMSYVFDLLLANNQLELLFKKGVDKEPQLKMALLDFLSRRPEVEREVYPMLAANFIMFREAATMAEENCLQTLLSLSSQDIEKEDIGKTLNQLLSDLANAADNYCMEECYQQAGQCVGKARLVALQLHLVDSSGQWVLNLHPEQVASFITNHSCFHEALLVAQEYQHHGSWASALFNQVVLHNNLDYLSDFTSSLELSPQLALDLAARFQGSQKLTDKNIQSFKELVHSVSCIKTKVHIFRNCNWDPSSLSTDLGGAYVKEILRGAVPMI